MIERLQVVSSEAENLVKEHNKLLTDLDGELDNRQVSQRAQDAYTQQDFTVKERDELTRWVRAITSQRDVIATQRSEIVDALSELRSHFDDTRKENGELAQQAMPALNELFDTIEAYSDITPGGMTYQSLNSSKILRTMKRISALEREDVLRDGEFQFRRRAKALVKKWKVVWEQGEEKARRENLA
ncbi:hypothetical protein ONZ45_g12734 [Pleurotus djamor]|nr:hypothetical protein ONZ45_g12734 [Pleurotus djamor]